MEYNYNYYSNYSPTTTAIDEGLLGAIMGALMAYLVVILVICIVQIIAMWKLFNKAGQKGWKSIIPIYNLVILFKISGLSPWLILVFLASIIPFVGFIIVIALNAVLAYKLAKSFGKDGGWAVGIFFLAPIFYMILAFGSSTYVGPGGEPEGSISNE